MSCITIVLELVDLYNMSRMVLLGFFPRVKNVSWLLLQTSLVRTSSSSSSDSKLFGSGVFLLDFLVVVFFVLRRIGLSVIT